MAEANDWTYWASALNGEFIEDLIQRGNPQSGFYRDRSKRAVAIWRDDDGALQCAVSSGYIPRHADEIDEIFGFVCRSPITRELFMHIRNGGAWPETVPDTERGIGDNNPPEDLTPDKALAYEIASLETQCRSWLVSLPDGKPSNKVEADLAANYADKFLAFEKRAIELHKAEKEPHLKAGREVDAKWFAPVRDVAKSLKEKINAIALAWARAEDNRKAEEARKANEELRRIANEENIRMRGAADVSGTVASLPPVAVVEVVPEKTKVGTSRARSAPAPKPVYVITDLPAFAAHLAAFENPPPEFMEACRTIANRLGAAGANPPGVEKRISEFVL
jgi:hypothetical protein